MLLFFARVKIQPRKGKALEGGVSEVLLRLLTGDEGQTLVEYGLLVALIALVVIAALTILGQKIANTFNTVNNALP